MNAVMKVIGLILLGLILAAVGIFISTVFFMLAWNYVIPYIFHLPKLNFWQAFAFLWVAWAILSAAKSTLKKE